ncbi:hypothetical protein HPP92_009421 [Vanilla planifolia]|uniref:Pectinesterase n=1 Tax=Vanilla planifolia TaxID=51239 RepID=A0A835RFN5_VANPL|nr:hypothetical protein HPP92_009421 [Vanilla planifolia]
MDSVTINDDSLSADENTTEIEEKARHGKNQLRITIITVSAFLLLAIIIFVSATTISRYNTNKEPGQYSSIYAPSNASTIKAVCATTRYPDSCYHSISAASSPNFSLDNPEKVFMLSLLVARAAVSNATFMSEFLAAATADPAAKAALQDCKELFSSAGDHLNDTLALLPADISLASSSQIIEMRTLLSAAVADQATCAEGVAATHLKARMQAATVNSTEYTSNSLAIATHFAGYFDMLPFLFHRKLLDAPGGDDAYYNGKFTVNVTVAKEGTGDLESIGDAIAKAPERSLTPFVIYVKEGVYKEYVVVGESKWNVVVLGDGMHRTLVVGNRSRADGSTAYKSATFSKPLSSPKFIIAH